MTAISHSCTTLGPAMISPARRRMAVTPSALARSASRSAHAVVTMHRPDSRWTSIDKPMQPSIVRTAGMTLSRTYAIPSSRAEGCARTVVERAYMPPLLSCAGECPGGIASRLTFLARASDGNGRVASGYGAWTPGDSAAEHVRRCFLVEPRRIGFVLVTPAGRPGDARDAAGHPHHQGAVCEQLEMPVAGEGL